MSRVGKAPIEVPAGVSVQVLGATVKVKGPLGELSETLHPSMRAELKDGRLVVTPAGGGAGTGALHGTARARLANLVRGTKDGFSKTLEVVGLGFKAQLQGEKLVLALGRSHPVEFAVPKGVKLAVDPKATQITVSGPSKEAVGAAAASIRSLRPPEPYKGTGIRYKGEHIVRKAGKTAAGAGAGAGAKK